MAPRTDSPLACLLDARLVSRSFGTRRQGGPALHGHESWVGAASPHNRGRRHDCRVAVGSPDYLATSQLASVSNGQVSYSFATTPDTALVQGQGALSTVPASLGIHPAYTPRPMSAASPTRTASPPW